MEVFQRLLRFCPDIRHLQLQGEGEPLAHPGFFEMVQMAKSRNPGVRISTITNGSLLAHSADQIVALGLANVRISIESADPALFRAIRGGRLDQVIEGVKALVATRQARGTEWPAVGFAVTVLHKTVRELPAIVALYETLGLDGGIGVQPLQQMPAYACYYGDETAAQVLSRGDHAELQQILAEDPGTVAVLHRRVKGTGFPEESFADWTTASGTCPWLEKGLYVCASGVAVACCFHKDPDRDGLGSLGEAGMGEIFARRREKAERLRHGILPAGCEGCPTAASILKFRGGTLAACARGSSQAERAGHCASGRNRGRRPCSRSG